MNNPMMKRFRRLHESKFNRRLTLLIETLNKVRGLAREIADDEMPFLANSTADEMREDIQTVSGVLGMFLASHGCEVVGDPDEMFAQN